MNKYDEIYKHQNVWGIKPSQLVVKVGEKLSSGSVVLDLGCGQGRNSIFLAQKGFKVDAVDKSERGLANIDHPNISTFLADIRDFEIQKNKYSAIVAINVIQFLQKSEMLEVVKKIKKNLKPGGWVAISLFIGEKGVEPGNLKTWFSDFNVLHYKEYLFDDLGHPGKEDPHQHHIAELTAQKTA